MQFEVFCTKNYLIRFSGSGDIRKRRKQAIFDDISGSRSPSVQRAAYSESSKLRHSNYGKTSNLGNMSVGVGHMAIIFLNVSKHESSTHGWCRRNISWLNRGSLHYDLVDGQEKSVLQKTWTFACHILNLKRPWSFLVSCLKLIWFWFSDVIVSLAFDIMEYSGRPWTILQNSRRFLQKFMPYISCYVKQDYWQKKIRCMMFTQLFLMSLAFPEYLSLSTFS